MIKKYRTYRGRIFLLYLALLLVFGYISLLDAIPDSISVEKGNEISVGAFLPVTKTIRAKGQAVESFRANECGTYELECRLFGLIPVKEVTVHIVDASQVIPCGIPIGIYIATRGVLVVDIGEVGEEGQQAASPASHILKKGDYITEVDHKEIAGKEELIKAVNESGGKSVILTVIRDGEVLECEIDPAPYRDGEYRIGAWVRDDLAGIGTLTYVDEKGCYGALGHGISDVDTDGIVRIEEGYAYLTEILSVVKGEKGSPGELVGQIRYDSGHRIGTITSNSPEGIFGALENVPDSIGNLPAMPIGYKQEIVNGPAQIALELDGERRLYEIEIEHTDMNAPSSNKSICLHVTDQELLKKTGGIIQGLSGSPIIQNGKFIGAVTHVFVNDPTRGYGIFAESMIEKSAGA